MIGLPQFIVLHDQNVARQQKTGIQRSAKKPAVAVFIAADCQEKGKENGGVKEPIQKFRRLIKPAAKGGSERKRHQEAEKGGVSLVHLVFGFER